MAEVEAENLDSSLAEVHNRSLLPGSEVRSLGHIHHYSSVELVDMLDHPDLSSLSPVAVVYFLGCSVRLLADQGKDELDSRIERMDSVENLRSSCFYSDRAHLDHDHFHLDHDR